MVDNRAITRAAIVAEALSWIGTPYRHQASLKGRLRLSRIDPRCLARLLRRRAGGDCRPTRPTGPRHAGRRRLAKRRGGTSLKSGRRRPEQGTCCSSAGAIICRLNMRRSWWTTTSFVHAQQGAAVACAALTPWWRRRIACAFRFPGVRTDGPSQTRLPAWRSTVEVRTIRLDGRVGERASEGDPV